MSADKQIRAYCGQIAQPVKAKMIDNIRSVAERDSICRLTAVVLNGTQPVVFLDTVIIVVNKPGLFWMGVNLVLAEIQNDR